MQKLNKSRIPVIFGILLIISVSAAVIVFNAKSRSKAVTDEIPNSDIYSTNSNGQTYGLAETTAYEQIPDLISAMGKNGTLAYMRKEDFLGHTMGNYETYTVPLSGDELEDAREQYKDQYSDVTKVYFYKKCFNVPLFDETGENKVDWFVMEIGVYPYP